MGGRIKKGGRMGERRKMERGSKKAFLADQVGILLMMHFPHLDPTGKTDPFIDLRCCNCEDLLQGVCEGEAREGWAVVNCMENKAKNGEVVMVVNGSEFIQ